MMRLFKLLFLSIIICVFSSCLSIDEEQKNTREFIDLNTFIQDIKQNNKTKSIVGMTTINGLKPETTTEVNFDLIESALLKYNLSKGGQWSNFTKTSTEKNNIKTIQYNSKKENQKIKFIEYKINASNQIIYFHGQRKLKSMLDNIVQSITIQNRNIIHINSTSVNLINKDTLKVSNFYQYK